ncbi:chemotaxis protein CheD [Bdellovibrio reynosensis]|uniref:Probable chemoreceptor glutamine deamidase CheD n=1 Tax=Bdellovibrio reynosensis TaxID=2835041 RepID=A0ABY4C4L9_9BACT|nr:chemotaxis protein CheD [Bdellovibrio reynosensis]UOE99886.1 chemotaxis protein CheD [Bdellovibrio reynosensis]
MDSFYLLPGKLAAFKKETIVSTLLGSCVAVALHDPSTGIGGLNHYLLSESGPEKDGNSPRYGIYAIPMLVQECVRLGANRQMLQAKIYGGANVTGVAALGPLIGKKNIQIAEDLLKSLGIPIVDKDVGGGTARTIKFNTATFSVIHQCGGIKTCG